MTCGVEALDLTDGQVKESHVASDLQEHSWHGSFLNKRSLSKEEVPESDCEDQTLSPTSLSHIS